MCNAKPEFTATHMRTSENQSADALPVPALVLLTPVIANLLTKAHSTRGNILRDAAHEAFLLFPTLVLGPQRPRASSSVSTPKWLQDWTFGDERELPDHAQRDITLADQRPPAKRSKTTRATRRASRLIRKNKFARATSMA